ncbi:MAG: cytochrome-c peroxidase, partial [Myxococcota bacterium]
MLGLDSVKTPTLRGIAATAPYFHDGSANSLREAIEVAARGLKETEAFGLTEEEYHALESFLRSL